MDEKSDSMEQQVEQAWSSFEEQLTEYVDDMPVGAILTIDVPVGHVPEEGCAPWIQLMRGDEGVVVATVSNEHLAPAYALDLQREQKLFAWGFARPGGPSPLAMLGSDPMTSWTLFEPADALDAEIVASAVVETLRQVFGVLDPAFIEITGSEDNDAWQALAPIEPPAEEPPLAVKPSDRDELVALVQGALTELRGEHVEQDDDGDFPLEYGGWPVCVRVRTDMPVIEIFTRVAHDVRSRRQTAVELAILNRGLPLTKFVLADRSVMMEVSLPALPFAPEHLASVLELFVGQLTGVRDDLALRTGARLG